jgi:hypothetical protein
MEEIFAGRKICKKLAPRRSLPRLKNGIAYARDLPLYYLTSRVTSLNDYSHHNITIYEEVDVVSKIISPHESNKSEPGYYYVFVDLKDTLEAADAVKKLDSIYKFDGKPKINLCIKLNHDMSEHITA